MGSEIHQRVIDTSRDGLDMAADANGATKPLAREADEQLRAQAAQLRQLHEQTDRLRALAAAGDLATIQALLAEPEPR